MLLFMLFLTVGQILFRSVLMISASWSEELAQYTFAFIVFAGAISVTRDENHITITMLLDILPPLGKRIFRIIGRLLTLPFLIVFSWGAFENTQSTWTAGLPTAEWMKIGYMYLVLFISGMFMSYHVIVNMVLDILDRKSASVASEGIQ